MQQDSNLALFNVSCKLVALGNTVVMWKASLGPEHFFPSMKDREPCLFSCERAVGYRARINERPEGGQSCKRRYRERAVGYELRTRVNVQASKCLSDSRCNELRWTDPCSNVSREVCSFSRHLSSSPSSSLQITREWSRGGVRLLEKERLQYCRSWALAVNLRRVMQDCEQMRSCGTTECKRGDETRRI